MPYIKTQQQQGHKGLKRKQNRGRQLKLHVACGKTIHVDLPRLGVELRFKQGNYRGKFPTILSLSLSLPFSASFCAQLIILINRTGAPQVVVEPYVMRAHLASRFPISPLCAPSWASVTVTQVVPLRPAAAAAASTACCLLSQFSRAPGAFLLT